MGGRVEWVSPDPTEELNPNSEYELELKYINESDRTHQLKAVHLAPTWELSSKHRHYVNANIPPGRAEQIGPIPQTIPADLTGRQGFRIALKVGKSISTPESGESPNYETIWMDPPQRWSITGTDRTNHQALVCVAGEPGEYQPINSLLKDYGYDPSFVESKVELQQHLTPGSNDITLVCGVLLEDGLSDERSYVISSMLPHAEDGDDITDLHRDAIGSVVVRASSAENAAWATHAHVYGEIESYERLELEREIGPQLRTLRTVSQTDLWEHLSDLAEELNTTPREIIDSWSTDLAKGAIAAGAEAQFDLLSSAISSVEASEDKEKRSGSEGEVAVRDGIGVLSLANKEGSIAVIKHNRLNELLDLLTHQNPVVRENATKIASNLLRFRYGEQLISYKSLLIERGAVSQFTTLLDDEEVGIRTEATNALESVARQHPKPVIKAGALTPLTACLDDEEGKVRTEAAGALGNVAAQYPKPLIKAGTLGPLTACLDDEEDGVREKAANTLGSIAKKYPKPVIKAGALTPLIDCLDDKEGKVRTKAAGALENVAAQYPKPVIKAGALDPLTDCLDDENERVQKTALRALENVAEQSPKYFIRAGALTPLTEYYARGSTLIFRGESKLESIADRYPKRVSAAVIKHLNDEEAKSREFATQVIRTVAKKSPKGVIRAGALTPLTDCLGDENEDVQWRAAAAFDNVAKQYPRSVMRARGTDGSRALYQLIRLQDSQGLGANWASQTLHTLAQTYPRKVNKAIKRSRWTL